MKTSRITRLPATRRLADLCLAAAWAMASVFIAGKPAFAASTDLSNQPLSTTQINARPNLMFILDDSGSMGYDYMPESINQWSSYTSTYGYRSYQCNGLAYNPSTLYAAPKTPLGASYPDMTLTAAQSDGYQPSMASSPTQQSSSVTFDMSYAADGSLTRTFPVSSTTGFAVGNTVIIQSDTYNGGSAAHWMMGRITSLASTSPRSITVAVTFSTVDSSKSYSRWIIGLPSTVDLSTSSTYYYSYSGTQPRMGWTYSSTGAIVNNTFYNECKATSGVSGFTKVLASSLSTSAPTASVPNTQTNYANWYAYYRKRILSMRASLGTALNGLNDSFRIGFTVISDTDAVANSNGFLPVDNFTTTQKVSFFSSLYNATPNSSTPLRGALSKVGRYYANAARGQSGHMLSGQTTATADPVQYTCQRNYALLSTDGYWNTSDENASAAYGPYKVDGSTVVGQQDGFDKRPQYDGSTTTLTYTYDFGGTTVSTQPMITTTVTHPQGAKVVTSCTTSSGAFSVTYNCTVATTPGYSQRTVSNTFTRTTQTVTKQTETITYTNGVITSDKTTPTTPTTTTTTSDGAQTLQSDTTTAWAATGSVTNKSTSCTAYFGAGCSGWSSGTTTTYSTDTYSQSTTTPNGTGTTGTTTPYRTQTNTPTPVSAGGSTSSLADIAEYYYVTPFRTSTTVNCALTPSDANCKGDLSPAGIDTATYQHMTTFTLGLGVNGQFTYDPNYLTQSSGDYFNVTRGYDNNNLAVNWPVAYDPTNLNNDVPGKIDDLWHAAVNGRGRYFSSADTASLSAALNSVLTTISAASGYGGSAAASSLKPVLGQDLVFLASYTTQTWNGDVKAYVLQRDSSGQVLPVTQNWSASDLLTARDYTTRNIYYYGTQTAANGSKVSTLVPFTYANLQADNLNGLFDNLCSKTPVPLQCASLTNTNLAAANSGTNLVNFLRGDRSLEISPGSPGQPFRTRASPLGDMINASPVYVGAPPFKYADSGYSSYASAQASRKKTIYSAANDGMLHAFSAESSDGGTERWAFVPKVVMSNMYKLADTAYKDNHTYFVDGTPVVGDIYNDATSQWRTIIVGGLNRGGKGYYALDITDPDHPAHLWQFDSSSDADLGYTFGNPIITKVLDQTSSTTKWIWAVLFTSGYNNTDGSGTGAGVLYVVNANTGALISKIKTTVPDNTGKDTVVGSTTTPSGLSKINVWIDSDTDNSAKRVYGGDLLGNVWRFDINGLYEPKNKSLRLAQLAQQTTSQGQVVLSNAQPVTARPELAEITYGGTKYPIVLVGTGRYLGQSDLSDTSQQALYAIKDPLTSTGWGAIQNSASIVTQTIIDKPGDSTTRQIQTPYNTVDWSSKIGWMVNLPSSKERIAIDMNLQYSEIGFISYVPTGTACSPSGKSWLYFLSITNGAATTTGADIGTQISSGLGTGITWFDLGNGQSTVLVPDDKMGIHSKVPPAGPSDSSSTIRRTSWRELVN